MCRQRSFWAKGWPATLRKKTAFYANALADLSIYRTDIVSALERIQMQFESNSFSSMWNIYASCAIFQNLRFRCKAWAHKRHSITGVLHTQTTQHFWCSSHTNNTALLVYRTHKRHNITDVLHTQTTQHYRCTAHTNDNITGVAHTNNTALLVYHTHKQQHYRCTAHTNNTTLLVCSTHKRHSISGVAHTQTTQHYWCAAHTNDTALLMYCTNKRHNIADVLHTQTTTLLV